MLHHQAAASGNPEEEHGLRDASRRIAAISRAHQRLYASNSIEVLDLGAYLIAVCQDLRDSMPGCEIDVEAASGIEIATDRAIPVALLVNELITNAAKYAYPDGTLPRLGAGFLVARMAPPSFRFATRALGYPLISTSSPVSGLACVLSMPSRHS